MGAEAIESLHSSLTTCSGDKGAAVAVVSPCYQKPVCCQAAASLSSQPLKRLLKSLLVKSCQLGAHGAVQSPSGLLLPTSRGMTVKSSSSTLAHSHHRDMSRQHELLCDRSLQPDLVAARQQEVTHLMKPHCGKVVIERLWDPRRDIANSKQA